MWWNWALARNGIYFLDDELKFFDFATGKRTSVYASEKPLIMGLAVSPDGKSILYRQIEVAEFGGGERRFRGLFVTLCGCCECQAYQRGQRGQPHERERSKGWLRHAILQIFIGPVSGLLQIRRRHKAHVREAGPHAGIHDLHDTSIFQA